MNETNVLAKDQTQTKEQALKEFGIKYNNFVKQIEIEKIEVISANFKKLDVDYLAENRSAEVKWKTKAYFENKEEMVRVVQRYMISITDIETKTKKGRVVIDFLVDYRSTMKMEQDIFDKFYRINLALNTWPYFREFVHNSVARMGWPPFIAPTCKIK